MAGMICTICGGTTFKKAFDYRFARSGALPQCVGCGSVERHRIVHGVLGCLGAAALLGERALQFARDPSIDRSWFVSLEVSQYGTPSSLDLHAIDRPDSSYDLVLLNHVLEHIRDDALGLSEIARILRPDGLLVLTVPSPAERIATVDWGRELGNGHFRDYGSDLGMRIGLAAPALRALSVVGRDSVTGDQDIVFVASRTPKRLVALGAPLVAAGYVVVWSGPGLP